MARKHGYASVLHPPILTFPLMGGRDTFCGFLSSPYGFPPPLRGRMKVGGNPRTELLDTRRSQAKRSECCR